MPLLTFDSVRQPFTKRERNRYTTFTVCERVLFAEFVSNFTEFDVPFRPFAIWPRCLCCCRFGSILLPFPDRILAYFFVRIALTAEWHRVIDSNDRYAFAFCAILPLIAGYFAVHWLTLSLKFQYDYVAPAMWLVVRPTQYPGALSPHSILCLQNVNNTFELHVCRKECRRWKKRELNNRLLCVKSCAIKI